ncbi:polysaccharide biosynthesis/export family protein [Maribacter cobaltidurans]|uniref:Sugar transporter n=1 Tax=Maribacter cobaltidurans TaxID=1178778 RepID=A0A223V055_9FLAO|nr:polysaccharide biosynthesis/export family protein [Maribacter cobaltidurans]ASV28833.1 sugar transporter [Maribacter cobaltidurans]GGD74425.1 polysaccharide biosynthesis protein [Maribacter cobaltidurans]
MKLPHYSKILRFFVIVIVFSLASCASQRDVVYFQGIGDYETKITENSHEQTFKVDDLIEIHVSTLDPEASLPFNLYSGVQDAGGRPEKIDYIVSKDGFIDFPVIGSVKVVGLSPQETKVILREKLTPYLKDPIINIRLKNFTVTILGEVKSPGTYPVNGEQITILEALGLANDLTIKGKRENVMVIRDFNGTKVYHRIDLTNKEALNSPVYYLTQNDVIYVEPNRSAVTSSALDNRASIWVSVASVLITSTVLLITRAN